MSKPTGRLSVRHLRPAVVDLVVIAGRRLRNRIETGRRLESRPKSSAGDVVTELDSELQRFLITALKSLVGGSGALGEEAGLEDTGHEARWIVDPIDGTLNVVHRLPHAAISVALQVNGRARLGVVHNPFSEETFLASRGGGAYVQRGADEASMRPIHVSKTSSLSHALVSFGLPYDRSKADQIFDAALRIFAASQDLRRRGSAALDLTSIADGTLDGHFELDLRPWDVSAAGLILEEAGGKVTNWDGAPIKWSEHAPKAPVLASNSALHARLLRILSRYAGEQSDERTTAGEAANPGG